MNGRSMKSSFNLSAWALKNQQLMVFFMLLMMAAGVMSYESLPRNEDPAFTIKTAIVSARWPGANVQDTINLLTDPIEKKLQETPYLDYVESQTRAGQSIIYVNLRDDTPPAKVSDVWYQVRKKMHDISSSLPSGVEGPAVDDDFDDTFGTIYGFTAEGYSPRELRDKVDDVRRDLMSLPDIGKISLLGVQEEQMVIAFSPRKLNGMGLDLQQIGEALRAQNIVANSGVLRTGKENIALRVSGALDAEKSLQAITLHIDGRYIPLNDIASISRQPEDPPSPAFRVNGQPAIGIAISMAPTGNMLKFGQAINSRMADIQQRLPHGIEMTKVADQSSVVKEAVNGFIHVLLEAVVIVLAVSFISLGTRAGLVVAAAIPIVLAMTFAGMMLCGIGLQRISLGALIIALGLLVDDAMISVEAMVARLEAGDSRWQAASYAFETTAFPMLTGTLVMIAGFIPVGFAASGAGEYCLSLFAVVMISLLCSWVVAILFTPLMGTWLLSVPKRDQEHSSGRIVLFYQHILNVVLRHRLLTLGTAVALLFAAAFGSNFIQGEFFPASDRPELLVSLTLPANASQEETARQTERLEAALKGNENIDHFSSYVGGGAIRFYLPMDVLSDNENTAQIVVVAKDLQARDRLKLQLDQVLAKNFSDLTTRVSPLELGPPVGWPIRYRVFGPDYEKVQNFAHELSTSLGESPASREVNLTAGEPERVITLNVNQTAARAAGVSSESLSDTLNTLYSGNVITSVRDGNRMIDVLLRGDNVDRDDTLILSGLMVTTAEGKKIPLSQVATPVWGIEDPLIYRHNRLPFIIVQTDVAPGMAASEASAKFAPGVQKIRRILPPGYQIQEGGAVAESDKGNSSVFAVLPITLIIMLVLLMVQLRKISRMLLALLMAPFGLIGVVAAMLPTWTPMGFVSLLGIIALSGMIIRNAVILISEVDSNAHSGLKRDDAIIAAAKHRSRPIFLTACAAILGMLPISRQVFWGPMAYAIIGGLFVATIITLTVLPAAISLVMQYEEMWRTRKRS
ncbi:efflux RND transporter permease subunit [Rahnella aquatilis]|nr:efflux RND transporter permease subunit [Rahnella aquatilis]